MEKIEEFFVQKGSWLSAASQFREELKALKMGEARRVQLLKEFVADYKTTLDHQLSAANVLGKAVGPRERRTFKGYWDEISKQTTGATVTYEGEKYKVEDVRENYKEGQNLYTICRLDSSDGVSVKLKCLKVVANAEELEEV